MEQQPRPTREPIINKFMQLGVVIQTIAITSTTLVAYAFGLSHSDPRFAETMAFVTLSMSELVRAFTARSERYPIVTIYQQQHRINLQAITGLDMQQVNINEPAFDGFVLFAAAF